MKFAKKFSNSVLRPIRPISWANWPWVVSHQVNIYSSSMYLGITTERKIFNSLFSCFACLYQSIIRHGCNGDAGIRTCDLCTFEGVWTIVDEGVFGMLTFSYRTFYSPHPGQLQGVKGTVSRDFLPFICLKIRLGPHINRRKRFHKQFCFCEVIWLQSSKIKCLRSQWLRGHANVLKVLLLGL